MLTKSNLYQKVTIKNNLIKQQVLYCLHYLYCSTVLLQVHLYIALWIGLFTQHSLYTLINSENNSLTATLLEDIVTAYHCK